MPNSNSPIIIFTPTTENKNVEILKDVISEQQNDLLKAITISDYDSLFKLNASIPQSSVFFFNYDDLNLYLIKYIPHIPNNSISIYYIHSNDEISQQQLIKLPQNTRSRHNVSLEIVPGNIADRSLRYKLKLIINTHISKALKNE